MANNNPTNPNTLAPVPTPDQFRNDALLPIANASGMTPAQMSASAQSLSSQNVLNAPVNTAVAVGPGNVPPAQTATSSWGKTGVYKEGGKDVYQEQTWNPSSGKFESVTFDNTTGNRAGTPIPVPPGRSTITGDAGASAASDLSLSITSREADLNNERLNQVNALRAAQMEEEKVIRDTFNARRATLGEQQTEQDKSQDVLAYRLGRKDTPYGVAEMANLQNDQARVMNELAVEESSLIQKSKQALAKGEYQASLDMRDEADRMLQRRIQTEQLNFQKQSQIREEKKFVQEQGKDVFNALALAGKEPSQELYDWYDSTIGVSGVGQGIYQAASAEKARLEIKDAREAQKADMDAASSLVTVLQKIPIGESITIGDNTYTGMDRGDIPKGTETDKDGKVTYWEFDRATNQVKTYDIGKIGKAIDGWTTQKDDNGRLWRVNAETKQMEPFFASESQKNWQDIFPEGSTSPFTDTNGKPRVQCGEFVNDMTGIGVGDSFESKISKMDIWKKGDGDPEAIVSQLNVGDVFTQKLGTWTGHTGLVLGTATKDGVSGIWALESNFKPGQVTSNRFIPLSQIDGFGKAPKLHESLRTGSDAPTFGGSKPAVLSLTELKEVNASLPPNRQLSLGATQRDATAAGYVPGAAPTVDDMQFVSPEDYVQNVRKALQEQSGSKEYDVTLDDSTIMEQYDKTVGAVPSYLGAADNIALGLTGDKKGPKFLSEVKNLLRSGDFERAKDKIKKGALDTADNTTSQQVRGRDNAVRSLEAIRDSLKSYKDNGGNTNIITGNVEEIAAKVGKVNDAKLRELATRMKAALVDYRRSISGAAFTEAEKADYDAMFPAIVKEEALNEANIDALISAFSQGNESFYRQQLGNENYEAIF